MEINSIDQYARWEDWQWQHRSLLTRIWSRTQLVVSLEWHHWTRWRWM